MPRFFFHVRDGISIPDSEGTELADWQVARFEAIRVAGEILKWNAKRVASDESWCMEVTDEWNLTLFRLEFNVMRMPVPAPSDAVRSAVT